MPLGSDRLLLMTAILKAWSPSRNLCVTSSRRLIDWGSNLSQS